MTSLALPLKLHYDPLGSTLALSDGGDRVLERHGYGPFGESDATGAAAFRFAAGRWDAETGLVWFGARAYSASLGRFVSPDPAGYAEGPHLYTYARNNPVGRIDPGGTCSGWADFGRDTYDEFDNSFSDIGNGLGKARDDFSSDPFGFTQSVLDSYGPSGEGLALAAGAIRGVSSFGRAAGAAEGSNRSLPSRKPC